MPDQPDRTAMPLGGTARARRAGLPKARARRGELVAALTALRKRQLEESTTAGTAYRSRLSELDWYQGGDYVITDEAGTPVHPEWYSDEFGRLLRRAGLRRAGLRRITLHDSRHTTLGTGTVIAVGTALFRPDISQVGADRASVMRCGRSLMSAFGCCCCCHRCCQPRSGRRPAAPDPACWSVPRRAPFPPARDRFSYPQGPSACQIPV